MATVPSEAYLLHLLRQRRYSLRQPMSVEVRALEFWRSIIGECLSSFIYVFLVCGAHVMWPLHSVNTLTKSFSNGFAMATAAHAFGHISGAHTNPALTLSMLVARRITPLRALFYTAAQCGGAIAGAALLYGVTSPSAIGGRESLGCTVVSDSLSPWQAAALETVLTFVVGLVLFASADPDCRSARSDALALGIAYLVCSLVALPATGASMNPARSLGPAFVMNTWTHHWVYWCGPLTGGVMSGLIYEYIFDSPRKGFVVNKDVKDSSSDVVIRGADFQHSTDTRDDSESKSSSSLPSRPAPVHQVTCFRASSEAPRPHSRGPQTKYGQVSAPSAYYSSLPRNNNSNNAYRTWSSEYGSSQQFKF